MTFGFRQVGLPGVLAAAVAMGGCTDRAAIGQQLYATHGCAVCHGATGRGDGPSAKTLSPPPRDFADPRHYTQGASEEAIADTIARGVESPTPGMPAFSHISEEERRAIAAWIVSLQKSGAASGKAAAP